MEKESEMGRKGEAGEIWDFGKNEDVGRERRWDSEERREDKYSFPSTLTTHLTRPQKTATETSNSSSETG